MIAVLLNKFDVVYEDLEVVDDLLITHVTHFHNLYGRFTSEENLDVDWLLFLPKVEFCFWYCS